MTKRQRPTRHRPKLGAMSVSLLRELMDNTLDAGYAEAATRRRQAEQTKQDEQADGPTRHRSTVSAHLLAGVGLLLIGLILGVAYRHTQRQAPQSAGVRQALVADVERETGVNDHLQSQAEDLTEQLADARDTALEQSEAGNDAATRLREMELAAALTPVRGAGVRIVLGDAQPVEKTDPVTGQPVVIPPDENGRVLDRDIQSIVNALWSAGAEAITIDGARLGVTTPIRAAGEAILVDLLPVSSPYSIDAIGNPDTLLPRFVDTPAASRLSTYSSTFGVEFTAERVDQLEMRAAIGVDPQYADPVSGTVPDVQPQDSAGEPSAPNTGGGR